MCVCHWRKSYLFEMSYWWWNFYFCELSLQEFISDGCRLFIVWFAFHPLTISCLQISLGKLWLNFVSITDSFSFKHLSFEIHEGEPRFSTIWNSSWSFKSNLQNKSFWIRMGSLLILRSQYRPLKWMGIFIYNVTLFCMCRRVQMFISILSCGKSVTNC